MFCPHCDREFLTVEVLANSSDSIPEASWVFFNCPKCRKITPMELLNGVVSSLEVRSAPGPNWEYIERIECADLVVRQDPKYLHCRFESQHYEYPER